MQITATLANKIPNARIVNSPSYGTAIHVVIEETEAAPTGWLRFWIDNEGEIEVRAWSDMDGPWYPVPFETLTEDQIVDLITRIVDAIRQGKPASEFVT